MATPQRYRTILLFGPPGSGKGTQGKILGAIPGFFHLSCGEVFRTIDVNSDLGRTFYEYSSRGELVPDDITIELWRQNIHAQTVLSLYKPHSDLLVLDGIPRNPHQAALMETHIEVLKVVHLVCEDEAKMVNRLRRRALKENRHDDASTETIAKRLRTYQLQTQPVLDYYPPALISNVDATESPAEVLLGVLDQVVPIQHALYSQQQMVSAVSS